MQILQSNNNCPDCLTMTIELQPLTQENNQWELYIYLDFQQSHLKILTGEIKFALRSAQLNLELGQGELKIHPSTSPFIQPIDNIFSTQCKWQIRHQPPTQFLQGQQQIKLGTITSSNNPPLINLTAQTQPYDIILREITGLWQHNLSPNKQAIIDRLLAQYLHQSKFNPYASQIIATIDNQPPQQSPLSSTPSTAFEEFIPQIKNSIALLSQTSDDNLSKLAQIVGLNPLTNLAGGNLVGTNLHNLDLSSANLQSVNLRGADLTDTDFSEANLSYARLNGADLSGAYLEGANLSYTNLNSASLALANLIGANLTNADLTKANLQNTTFAQAQLQGAIFADNLGITADKEKTLQAQGAVFRS